MFFLITESTYDRCSAALTCVIKLLRKLGFYIKWNKFEGPSQRLIFLGILIATCLPFIILIALLIALYHD